MVDLMGLLSDALIGSFQMLMLNDLGKNMFPYRIKTCWKRILIYGVTALVGYHLTLGSGKLRKIMDENIESVEKFIAHQLPDFVASLVAPLVLVIILLGIDWRYGIVCLVGIVLAFIVQFAGFNGEAKEKMHRFQTAQENMNSASVEYVRGMPEIKAFNQTADSFKRLSKSITDYTSFVLEYALGWQNCMPAFTTRFIRYYHKHDG